MATLSSSIDPTSETFQANAAVYDGLLKTLRERQAWSMAGGGERMVTRHRARGKIPVRERIDLLLDPLSPFLELSPLAAWGLYDNAVPGAARVTGIGTIPGVACMGGATLAQGDEVFPDQDHFGGAFYRQCRMSAAGIPQIAAVFGECTAGGAYIPALSDEVVMTAGNSSVHLGGPQIVKAAIREIVDRDTLGGAEMHSTGSRVSDHFARDEMEAIAKTRDIARARNLLQPVYGDIRPARAPLFDIREIPGIVGADLKQPFDQREIIARIVDGSEFHEFKPLYGATLVCGFAHIHGLPIGLIAHNGRLFSDSSLQGAHFIELCDQRNVPILVLQNITGFMVGSDPG